MKIKQLRILLDQIEEIDSDIEVRIVVARKDINDHVNDLIARPVYQDSAWNNDEIVFKDVKS